MRPSRHAQSYETRRMSIWLGFLTFIFSLGLANCTYETPATETPPINTKSELIPKTFFVNKAGQDGKTEAKAFLCAWAPVTERGSLSERYHLHMAPTSRHCNLEWKITKDYLVGRMVNPSYPNNREQWKQIITIPITKHYYWEKDKDQYGRETNRYIKNDQRDPWNRRPYIDLDLSRIQIRDWAHKLFMTTPSVTAIEDIEVDQESGFLAFTMEASDAALGTEMEGRFRFNFLKINENPKFDVRPYDTRNSQKLNIVHLMGKKVEGTRQVLYAAHWDLKKQHEIHLTGFPEEYLEIGKQVVADWNKTLQDIKAVKKGVTPFKAVVGDKDRKYFFDLRYPSIHWVEDARISSNSPLGVGVAHANVKTGEILWGGVVIYGGKMESYVNHFSPVDQVAASETAYAPPQVQTLFDKDQLLQSLQTTTPGLPSMQAWLESQTAHDVLRQAYAAQERRLTEQLALPDLTPEDRHQIQTMQRAAQDAARSEILTSKTAHMGAVAQDMMWSIQGPQTFEEGLDKHFNTHVNHQTPELKDYEAKYMGAPLSKMSFTQSQELLRKQALQSIKGRYQSNAFDFDRTFLDVSYGWQMAKSVPHFQLQKGLENVVKFTLTHEMGHILGLGHQYEASRLPEKGTLPEAEFDKLWKAAQNGYQNYTSVMDYLHPTSEMTLEGDIKPGIHDEHVLRYLYKQEFPVYISGDKDYQYFKVPHDGYIPDQFTHPKTGAVVKSSYVPACNDLEAMLATSPYCAQFDRGYNAETIVKTMLEDLTSNLIIDMNNFTEAGGGNAELRSAFLWSRSLKKLGRARTFYDRLRYILQHDQKYKPIFDQIRQSPDLLYSFAEGCANPSALDSNQDIFARLAYKNPSQGKPSTPHGYTEINDLCRATSLYLSQIETLMRRSGSDHNVIDYDAQVLPGGILGGDAQHDWSRLNGVFKEIGSLPLRLSSLMSLTTPRPYFIWNSYPVPIATYSDAEGKYGLFSLYPKSFTRIVKTALRSNLSFGEGTEQDSAEMGNTVLYLRYFLNQAFFQSNDTKRRFPQTYIDNIRKQTEFSIGVTPIILTAVNGGAFDKPLTRVFKFKAAYFDRANEETFDIPYAYILPDREVIAKGLENQLFLPLSKFRFVNDNTGYLWAYELRYNYKHDDPLIGESVRSGINRDHEKRLRNCVFGNNNGLESFFNEKNPEFDGFEVLPGIATNREFSIRFSESIKRQFEKYYSSNLYGGSGQPERPLPNTCEESIKGIALVTTAAAALNNYYLIDMYDFLAQ